MPQPNYMRSGDTPPDDFNEDNLADSEVVSIDIGANDFLSVQPGAPSFRRNYSLRLSRERTLKTLKL